MRGAGPRGPAGAAGSTGAAGATGATGSGGGALDPIPALASLIARSAGTFTTGGRFSVDAAATLSWVEVYVVRSGTETWNVTVWDAAGASQGTKAVSVTIDGRTRFTFAAPLALTAGAIYTLGVWNSTNAAYLSCTNTQALGAVPYPVLAAAPGPVPIGGHVLLYTWQLYAAGNGNKPVSQDTANCYPFSLGGLAVP